MMQYAWAAVFLFAGFLGCVQEYHAIQQGQALPPWGRACRRDASPRTFWLLTSLGIAGSSAAIILGMALAIM